MPQFDISTFSSQLFWLVLVFGFLYIVVSKFIAPKAQSILTSRHRYLEDNIDASEDYNHQARNLRQAKEDKLEELNADAEEIRRNAVEAMEAYFTEKKTGLAASLDKKTKEAEKEIRKYMESFHLSEGEHVSELAAFIIEKITDKPADLKLLKEIQEVK